MKFEPFITPVTYGNGRKAFRWQVLFRDEKDKPVGITRPYLGGKCMESSTRREAIRAAKVEIKRFNKRRLVAFHITKHDIENGEGRNSQTCAVAQSIWRVQEDLGYDRWDYDFEISTYGFMIDAKGIRVRRHQDGKIFTIDAPPIVGAMKQEPGWYEESMEEWTMLYDDWEESRDMTAKEWREYKGEPKPYKPSPCSFVLDLDELFSAPTI